MTKFNITFIHIPHILFLACNPLCGRKRITPDHCATKAMTDPLVRSGEIRCSGEDWSFEHRVHLLLLIEQRGRNLYIEETVYCRIRKKIRDCFMSDGDIERIRSKLLVRRYSCAKTLYATLMSNHRFEKLLCCSYKDGHTNSIRSGLAYGRLDE